LGYDGVSKVQDVTSQWGIRLATGLLPAVMILVGMFFWARYPIDKETEDRVEAETLARHRPEQETVA
jgi:Na+/melibiose symporter-like transporter